VKPFLHAKGSVSRWGGKPEDYMAIHDFLDSSKACMPDMRHRAVYHHALGCYLVERIFGHTLVNSDGREVSTRDVAEQHIIQDLGFLPSVEDWLDELPMSTWHGGIHRLPKDERPPTPAEAREETRDRVRAAFSVVGDLDYYENQNPRLIDDIIAAARGANKDEE
jgi:hypothetical protein